MHKSGDIGRKKASDLIMESNDVIECEVEIRPDEWDGFKSMKLGSLDKPLRGLVPNALWFGWMRRWYIRGNRNRPTRAEADFFWIFPNLMIFRGEKTEVDRAFHRVKSALCKNNSNIVLETIPFDYVWFLWIFENVPVTLMRQCRLNTLTDIRLIGGDEGYEGRDMHERKSADVTRSLFTAAALLLSRNIAGITCESTIGAGEDRTRVSVTMISGPDDRTRPTHKCEILKTEVPIRGAFSLRGTLTLNEDINSMKFAQALIIGEGLARGFEKWRKRRAEDRVPSDDIADRLLEIVDDSIADITEHGPQALKEWLGEKRRELGASE